MTADQNTFASLNGVTQDSSGNPTQTGLTQRPVRVRGRQVLKGLVSTAWGALFPFAWPNTSSPTTTSAFDYMEGTAEQIASRFVDPYGNVINFMTTWVVDWFWKLDGAPPLTQAKLAEYLQLANQLNPWPEGYAGISQTQFPGEDFATYPAWPPTTPVALNTFLPTAENPNGSNTAGPL